MLGTRAYEVEEENLLANLGVKYIEIEDCIEKGLSVVFKEAEEYLLSKVSTYGVSIDMSVIDPEEMPAVNNPEPFGFGVNDFKDAIRCLN